MGDIKLICWNVRGLNCAARREAVKISLQQTRPDIVCLQETKLDSIDRFLALEFLGPACMGFEYFAAESTRGGILVAWDQNLIQAGPPHRQRFSISIELTMKLSNASFLLTSVYGPTDDSLKSLFLNELVHCQPMAGIARLCLGDFNLICEARDKNNDNINRRNMGRFRRALDASELIEIRLLNRRYTWSNGRACPTPVHLDRVFCNKDWDSIFPAVSLLALSSSLSDHSPLYLCTQQRAPSAKSVQFQI